MTKFIDVGKQLSEESKKNNWDRIFFSNSGHYCNNHLDMFGLQFPRSKIQIKIDYISALDNTKEPVMDVYKKKRAGEREYLGSFFPGGHLHYIKSKFKRYNVREDSRCIEDFHYDPRGIPKIGDIRTYKYLKNLKEKFLIINIEDPKPSDGVEMKSHQFPDVIVEFLKSYK